MGDLKEAAGACGEAVVSMGFECPLVPIVPRAVTWVKVVRLRICVTIFLQLVLGNKDYKPT